MTDKVGLAAYVEGEGVGADRFAEGEAFAVQVGVVDPQVEAQGFAGLELFGFGVEGGASRFGDRALGLLGFPGGGAELRFGLGDALFNGQDLVFEDVGFGAFLLGDQGGAGDFAVGFEFRLAGFGAFEVELRTFLGQLGTPDQVIKLGAAGGVFAG